MPKETHKNRQPRQPLKPSIVVLNDNRILNDQLKYQSVKLVENKSDDVRSKGNDILAQNACKMLNIPHQSNMYKDLIEIDCMDNEQNKCRTSSRKDKNAKATQSDLEPEPVNCSQLVKHEYLINAFGASVPIVVDTRKDDAKVDKRKPKQKRFPSKSRLITKIQEWNALTE